MRQTWAALLSLASMIFAPILPAIAQDVISPSDPGIATYDGGTVYSGSAPYGSSGGYFYFRKDIDNGVGYREGFSTIGGFLPFVCTDDNIFFMQSQVFIVDDGEVGANVGGGYRHYASNADRVFGVYGFYDTDESRYGYRNDQIGIGLETLGPMWDFRANGYIPLDNDQEFVRLNTLSGPPQFVGNNLILNGNAFFERTMGGGDFEFGFPLLDPSAFGRLRSYFGGYAYDAEVKDQVGVRVRLEGHVNEHITVGAAFMHDDVNGDMVTMAVDIRGWDSRLPDLNNREPSNRAKMFLPAVRQYRIAHDRFLKNISAQALGEDGTPLTFVWVDNSNPGGGSGTFEDPFTNLPAGAPGADYILVRRGDSSETNPVLGGIVLEDDQRLFGEGFQFFVTVSGTEFGPEFNGDYAINSLVTNWNIQGFHPYLSNPGGDVVTLANNNQVGGFNIIGSGGHGIVGTGIEDFELFSLNIGHTNPALGNAGTGILLVDATGTGSIRDFTLLNNAGGGLVVENVGVDPLTLTVDGDTGLTEFPSGTITPNVTGGIVGLSLIAEDAEIDAEIRNFYNSGSETGANLAAVDGGNLDVSVTNGFFNSTTAGDGIVATVDDATLNMTLTDVSANGAAGNALSIQLSNGAVFTGDIAGTQPFRSSFSGALGGDGVRLIADNSPNANSLNFQQTSVNGNAGDGLHVELTNGSNFALAFTDGTIDDNFGDAIDTSLDGASTLDLFVDPSSMNDSGENGFRFNVVNSSILTATFDQVSIAGSGQNGILGTLDTLGEANLNFTDVTVSESDEHGMFITALGGSTVNGLFDNASFSDNNQSAGTFDGINLVVDDSAVTLDFSTLFAGNTFGVTSQFDGIEFLARNGAALDITVDNASIESNSGNGILGAVHDPGTLVTLDFSNAGIDGNDENGIDLLVNTGAELDATFTDSSASSSGINGVQLVATNADTIASLSVSNFAADNNGDRGFDLLVDDQAELTASVSDSSSASGNGLDGFLLTANDAGTVAQLLMSSDNQFNNNFGAGVRVTAADVDEITAIVSGSASGNAEEGVEFNIDNVTDVVNTPTAVAIGVTGSGDIENNGFDGVQFNVTNSTVNSLFVDGANVSSNTLNGVQVNVATSTVVDSGDPLAPALLFANSSFDNNLGGDGLEINLTDVVVPANNMAIASNSSISGNAGDGISLNLTNSPIDGLQIVDNQNISENGEHGIHFELTDSNLTNLDVSGNVIADNGDSGIVFDGNSNVDGTFDGNDVSGNQGEGVEITLTGTQTFAGTFTGSTFNNNSGVGLLIDAQDNSSYNVVIGGANVEDGNSFDGNTGAAIGILMSDSATGSFGIENNIISNTLAAAGPFFVGQGIHLRMLDAPTLSSLSYIRNNEISGAADSGIDVQVQDNAVLQSLTVSGNFIEESGDGIRFVRLANGRIGFISPVQILDNEIIGGDNGITIAARNAPTTDSYVLNDNIIEDVASVGIVLEHGFDASLDIDMDGNEITGSGSHGIRGFQTAGTLANELRRLSGLWQNLLIDDNGGDGILLESRMGPGLTIATSTITNNAGVGLNLPGPGELDAVFNLIEGNGSHGILVNQGGFKNMAFANNTIRLNAGDGFRLVNNGNQGGFGFFIGLDSNLIELNQGRGINVLNQGNADTNVTALGNTINSNGLEGVYIVNTASTTQSADFNATLAADGDVFADPRLFLTFNNNEVFGNGNVGKTTSSGGFVLRVGTADASTDFTDQGGFANTRAGVIATVSGNTFTGNAGFDVYFDSFVSTVDPPQTASSDGWEDQNDDPRDATNDVFDIDNYVSDPLARLDLVFTNNTGDELDATNPGAFYTNDEPVFKSRTQDQDGDDPGPPDDNGPFSTGTRSRNAQRLADRLGLPPTITAGSNFLYPGIGQSTFRVSESGNSFTVTNEGFLFDVAPYNDFGDAFGVDSNDNPSGPFGGNAIDAMPWGWSVLP